MSAAAIGDALAGAPFHRLYDHAAAKPPGGFSALQRRLDAYPYTVAGCDHSDRQ